jgi:hypothetical protein
MDQRRFLYPPINRGSAREVLISGVDMASGTVHHNSDLKC